MTLKAVILDFDFTLVDSSRGFIECHDYACRELALPPVAARDSMAMMGTPLAGAFRLLFDATHHYLVEDYLRCWQSRADEVMTQLTEVFAETPEALARLKRDGLLLGIVSQKLRRRIDAVLERESLTKWFDVIVGGGDISALKPDPEGLRLATLRLGVDPAEALYVGDTTIDALAAANAAMPFVAVLSGVTPLEAFEPFQRLAVIESIAGLPDVCRSLS